MNLFHSVVFISTIALAFSVTDPSTDETGANTTASPDSPPINAGGDGVVTPHITPPEAKHTPNELALINIVDCNVRCLCQNVQHCNPDMDLEKKSLNAVASASRLNSTRTIPLVVMMSNGSDAFKLWRWQHINMVISSLNPEHVSHVAHAWELLCKAHSMGKRFGHLVNVNNDHGQFNTYKALTAYIKEDMNNLMCSYDSLYALNLVNLLIKPTGLTVDKIGYLLATVKLTLTHRLPREKLFCVIPWKLCPTNYPLNCETLAANLEEWCDHLLMNPDSFKFDDTDCKAKPEVSMLKLAISVDEYVSRGVEPKKIILGVPWHGFDHTCYAYDHVSKVCKYDNTPSPNNPTADSCKIMPRAYQSLGNMALHKNFYVHLEKQEEWSATYETPFYVYTDTNGATHQVWYENWQSLSRKYKFVREFDLGGVSIFSGDDLLYNEDNKQVVKFDDSMWSYLDSGLYYHSAALPKLDNASGRVAGAAIGCLLLGALIGCLATYIGCVRQRRWVIRPPFRKDAEQFVDEPDM